MSPVSKLYVLLQELNSSSESDQNSLTEQKDKCLSYMNQFVIEHAETFHFKNDMNNHKPSIVDLLISTSQNIDILKIPSLSCLRLLSRDDHIVHNISDISQVLEPLMQNWISETQDKDSDMCKIESLRSMCNFVYHSPGVREYFKKKEFLSTQGHKILSVFKDPYSEDLFYAIRIVFLMSALEVSERAVLNEAHFVPLLTDILEAGVRNYTTDSDLATKQRNVCSDILKTLFNLCLEFSSTTCPQTIEECARLTILLREMLIMFQPYERSRDSILSHMAHMLVNIPKEALANLLVGVPVRENQSTCPKINEHPVEFEGYDMSPILILLNELEARLDMQEERARREMCMSLLTSFCYICRVNPTIRKYLRREVLPTITNVCTRPEQLDNLRGKIVRLMTDIDVPLKNMAADFLFVLCKENTNRLIRYAGYGNSAGFLASRGLMIPGIQASAVGEYSTDEESDSEYDHQDIDVVTGATAAPKEDVFKNLTEDEKEREAEKLMEMIDKLSGMDVIKPMTVDQTTGQLTELKTKDLKPKKDTS